MSLNRPKLNRFLAAQGFGDMTCTDNLQSFSIHLPIKVITSAVINIVLVIFHAKEFITVVTSIIFKLVKGL